MRSVVLSATLATGACDLDTAGPVPDEPMTLVGADRQSRIYVVDEASGAATLLDSVLIVMPGSFPPRIVAIGQITSMSWVPSSDMWWLGTSRGSPCPSCIYRYHSGADEAFLVRMRIEEVDTLADFAVHPSNGRVYTFMGGRAGYLFRVNVTDGFFHEVMQFDEGESGKGSTFWTDGHLYVSGGLFQQVLTRIEIERASATRVGPVTYVDFPHFSSYSVRIRSMATRASDGTVFGLVLDDERVYLATVDPTNAVVRHVGETSPPLNALAYVPTRLLP
jgi:hypothetical protein